MYPVPKEYLGSVNSTPLPSLHPSPPVACSRAIPCRAQCIAQPSAPRRGQNSHCACVQSTCSHVARELARPKSYPAFFSLLKQLVLVLSAQLPFRLRFPAVIHKHNVLGRLLSAIGYAHHHAGAMTRFRPEQLAPKVWAPTAHQVTFLREPPNKTNIKTREIVRKTARSIFLQNFYTFYLSKTCIG